MLDRSIFVPMADSSVAVQKLNLSRAAAANLATKLKRIEPIELGKIVTRRDVHLFAGTHVEAVAGHCVLPDLTPVSTTEIVEDLEV